MENQSPVKYKELKSPLTAQIELTQDCTNKCIYCYNYWRNRDYKLDDELSFGGFSNIIDKLSASEIFEIIFTGGEPLLRKDILYPLIEKSQKNNIDVRINSNLSLLEREDIKKLKYMNIKGMLTSLSSYNEDTHNLITQSKSFKKIIKNIESLVKEDIDFGVNMVVTQQNKENVYKTGKYLYNLGVKVFCSTPVGPCFHNPKDIELETGHIKKVFDDLIKLKEELGIHVDTVEPVPRCLLNNNKKYESFFRRDCSAGRTTLVVSPKGYVRPCTHVSKEYGNLLEENLKIIWKRVKEWRDGSFVPKKCSLCDIMETCSMGCREAARTHFGSFKDEDPWIINLGPIKERKISKKDVKLDKSQFYRLSQIKFRKEDDNYIIFSSKSHSFEYINKDFFNLLKYLNSLEKFSIYELENRNIGNKNILQDAIIFLNKGSFLIKEDKNAS